MGDRKRKRAEDDVGGVTINSKSTQKENDSEPAKSRAQSRQERSERRSNKVRSSKKSPKQETIKSSRNSAVHVEPENDAETYDENGTTKDDIEEKLASTSQSQKSKKSKRTKSANENDSPNHRFIVFVGNLPYNTTTAQIQSHFAKLSPKAVRHSTDKATARSKGFAFLEFETYDRMETCLRMYHHSIFDPTAEKKDDDEYPEIAADGEETRSRGRRINVELTAGGGGKSKNRKEKIKGKNTKLDEERERRRIKQKLEQEKSTRQKSGRPASGANSAGREDADANSGIHPDRLNRMKRS